MILIVDTNIILSALIKDSLSREIITSQNIEFYTVDYTLTEIKKYMDYIMEKSNMQKDEIETLIALFMENITIISDGKIKSKIKQAKDIMKDIDIKDAPILAGALAIPNDGIWTEDKHFEKQNKIRIWKTKDLIEYI